MKEKKRRIRCHREVTVELLLEEAQYIIDHKATIRSAADHFNISKSTLHKDMKLLAEQLRNNEVYSKVREVFDKHLQERQMTGGLSSKRKFAAIREERLRRAKENNCNLTNKWVFTRSDERGKRAVQVVATRDYKTVRYILDYEPGEHEEVYQHELWAARNLSDQYLAYRIDCPFDMCIIKDAFDMFSITEDKRQISSMNPTPVVKIYGKFVAGPKELSAIPMSEWHSYLISNGYRYLGKKIGYLENRAISKV